MRFNGLYWTLSGYGRYGDFFGSSLKNWDLTIAMTDLHSKLVLSIITCQLALDNSLYDGCHHDIFKN